MQKPRIYADFQNADPEGRIRLNCAGTLQDLARQQIQLEEGLVMTLYADDADASGKPDELCVTGVAQYSHEEGIWVAAIDWTAIRHGSETPEIRPSQGVPKRQVG